MCVVWTASSDSRTIVAWRGRCPPLLRLKVGMRSPPCRPHLLLLSLLLLPLLPNPHRVLLLWPLRSCQPHQSRTCTLVATRKKAFTASSLASLGLTGGADGRAS
jgi:hypothetical protein